jgi:hypothetical protein
MEEEMKALIKILGYVCWSLLLPAAAAQPRGPTG